MRTFIRLKKRWVIGVILLFTTGWFLLNFLPNGTPIGITIEPVTFGEVSEVVSETGLVVASQDVNLSFERSGKISEIFVKEGNQVKADDILIKTDSAQQEAELASAYARLNAEQIRLEEMLNGADSASLAVTQSSVDAAIIALENTKYNLSEVTAQQDTIVKNALKTLRSSGLQAYLINGERENSTYSYTAPTITGTYQNDEEGMYNIKLYGSASLSGSSFVVSGLESDTQPVSTINPIAFGTHGLYLQFPDNFAPRTEWEIPIPNVHSSVYLTNLNAYNYALENRNVAVLAAENAVKSAEASLVQVQKQFAQVSGSARDERIAAQEALVEQMQAAVLVAQVSHNNTIIKAPFSGTVIDISAEVGEIVMGATSVISLVSNEDFELLVNISESDIQEIGVGDVATVTFDAYKELSLEAYVTSISPSANVIEGVRVFETRLQFKKKNDLIRIGLSADIDILAETKTNVIAVPSRSIVEEDSAKFVRTLVNNKLELLPVTVGLHGSNGMTEVISGLTEGQEIITFAQEEVLSQLESN